MASVNEPFQDWQKDEAGMLTVCPFAGYDTAVFQNMIGLVRLEFVRSAELLGKQHEHLQLGMSLAQAKELGEELLRMASKLDLSVPADARQN